MNFTIKSKSSFDNFSTQKTYELNEQGLIKKISSSGNTITDELNYEGDNVVWYGGTSHLPTYVYQYETVTQPVGPYVNIRKNMYGNANNILMMGGFAYVNFLGSNYLTKWFDTGGNLNYEYKYEFDEEGYPVKVNQFFGGSINPVTIKEIFYK